jgi:hypothetical protein
MSDKIKCPVCGTYNTAINPPSPYGASIGMRRLLDHECLECHAAWDESRRAAPVVPELPEDSRDFLKWFFDDPPAVEKTSKSPLRMIWELSVASSYSECPHWDGGLSHWLKACDAAGCAAEQVVAKIVEGSK